MNSRILPSIALMIAIGIFFAYVNPTWTGPIAATKTAIANDEQALDAAKEYTDAQNTLASARAAIPPANLEKISTFLPDSVDNVGMILDVNALVARSGLVLSNINVAKNDSGNTTASGNAAYSSQANPIGSVDLSLSAVGTYASLKSFLGGIEKSARLLDVQNIAVSSSDTGVYRYQMTIRLYWLR